MTGARPLWRWSKMQFADVMMRSPENILRSLLDHQFRAVSSIRRQRIFHRKVGKPSACPDTPMKFST